MVVTNLLQLIIFQYLHYRISVFKQDLTHVRNVTHPRIVFPTDVKLTRDKLADACYADRAKRCVHTSGTSLTGEHVHYATSLRN